jgi:RimJ/RimL family protein N-acetyltransferase
MPLYMTRENQPELLEIAANLTSSTGFLPDALALGFRRAPDQPVVGVAVFEGFQGRRAIGHLGFFAGYRMTRETIQALCLFAFNKMALNLQELRVRISTENRQTLALAIKSGFEVEYRDRAGFAGGNDAIVLSMLVGPALLDKPVAERQEA